MDFVKHVAEAINSKNIPLRFTHTNPMLEKKHLGDPFCNQVMRMCNNGFNEAIVMSPVLEEYIRENYPDYPITSSTCKQIEQLEQIDEKDRARCEVLVNACCTPKCKRRGEHYRSIGLDQIAEWEHKKDMLSKKPFIAKEFACDFMNNGPYAITDYVTYISPQAVFEKYLPMGFNNFKIEGRTLPDICLLEYYIIYMVKPEYQNKIRLDMLQALTGKHKYFI